MDKHTLTAPCGIDCFNCHAHENNVTDEYRKEMAQRLGLPPDEVACKGCKPEQGRCRFTQNCATWACTQEKSVEFCYECNDFPCDLLAPTAQGVRYPHNMKVYNLCRIKQLGLDAWAKEAADIRKRYYEGQFVIGRGPVLESE